MDTAFLQALLGVDILSVTPLRGGDIANAFKVLSPSNAYFVKTASFPNALEMLEAEAVGLQHIRDTNTIQVPKVQQVSFSNTTAYLVMDYVAPKSPEQKDMVRFGKAMAQLHSATFEKVFGFPMDNYIGRLAQSNTKHHNWTDFYLHERILPQLKMAVDTHLFPVGAIPTTDRMEKVCSGLFGRVTASLLHGDLWSGNYLISSNGIPYLIDPAVYYGHNEMDLAMTRLFGGFSASFYDAYHDIVPPHPNQSDLTALYQLYYLLVHLNLFGTSYLPGVQRIVTRYFG